MTGGITPVYAAPETFDGWYQPLLRPVQPGLRLSGTADGQRPFDGTSMSQLLMQHLQMPPNLAPSPACDRPALTRALAKKAEDRWPNVSMFVRTLRDGGDPNRASAVKGLSGERPMPVEIPPTPIIHGGIADLALETPFPKGLADTESLQPIYTPAPPEISGDGPLRPALIIGIGLSGLRVLQRFRFDQTERFGPPEYTPLVRCLYIDTDTETLEEAAQARPTERLAGLRPEEIFAAKLNRAGHYMKPRLNGRTLTEGWFDTQLLYKIPRTPQTMGLRSFGRLAFCDHYRPLMGRIHTELDACLSLDSLHLTEQRTSLRRRTNRPRVYIVAGIAGGTGGGMFLDAAYAVRTRMKRMGYENPDVVGVLIVPPADAMLTPPQALGNTYAALTELNHFSRPQSTFVAHYDERQGQIREKQAAVLALVFAARFAGRLELAEERPATGRQRRHPAAAFEDADRHLGPGGPVAAESAPRFRKHAEARFARVIPCIPIRTEDSTQTSLRPYTDAAELLRLELFTALGHAADELRKARIENDPSPGVKFAAFGVTAFDWPRAEVVSRTAAAAARNVLKNWLAPNLKRAREVVPTWAAAQWTQFGLDPEAILAHLQQAMELAVGGKVEELIALTTEPLVPRGWLARLPEPEKIQVAVDRLVKLLGPPISVAKRKLTIGEAAVHNAALTAAEGFTVELSVLGHSLVEDPEFRLAGAEEVLRQFLATTDRLMTSYVDDANQAEAKAQTGFECLVQYMHFQKGMRKPAAGEMADALRQFPRARYQAFTYRELAGVYKAIREVLAGQLADVADARQRMETAAAVVEPEPIDVIPRPAAAHAPRLPRRHRCRPALPRRHQRRRPCGNRSPLAHGPGTGTRRAIPGPASIPARAGKAWSGCCARKRDRTSMAASARSIWGRCSPSDSAASNWPNKAWARRSPMPNRNGWRMARGPVRKWWQPRRPAARPAFPFANCSSAVPVAGLVIAESRDDLTIYRELPLVPISAVPHLGPAGATAYQNLPETLQCSLHTRLDVTAWTDVDAD